MQFVFLGKSDIRRPFHAVTKSALMKGFTLPVFSSRPWESRRLGIALTTLDFPNSREEAVPGHQHNPLWHLLIYNICICKAKPSTTETVVECHGDSCKNWKIFPPYLPQFKQNAQQLLEMFWMQQTCHNLFSHHPYQVLFFIRFLKWWRGKWYFYL